MLSNLSVKARLGLGFSVLIIIGAIVAVFGRDRMIGIGNEMDVLVNDTMVKHQMVVDIRNNTSTIARLARNIALLTDAAAMAAEQQRIGKLRAETDALYSQLGASIKTPQGQDLLRKAGEVRGPYNLALDKAIDLGLQNQNDAARDVLLLESRPLQNKYFTALEELLAFEKLRMSESAAHAQETVRTAGQLMLAAAAAAALLGAVLAWRITRSLTGQLGGEPAYAAEVARHVANGKLDVAVTLHPQDRHSMLAMMRDMRDSLAAVVSRVRASSLSVASASAQIAEGNRDLSARTESQASALEETAASMEQLHTAVHMNAEHARAANTLAINASEVAATGGAVVGQVVQTMRDIHESSRQISDIIGVIDGIAFQTNILALNAAVEAARAGEQGRGFAVVASEVRVLAGRSAEAAKAIKALISNSVDRVDQGTALADRAGATMADVVSAIQRVTSLMGDISSASDEQALSVAAVVQAIGQMDQATQQNATLVEEMAAAAAMMHEQAEELVASVSLFQLGERAHPPAHRLALAC